jgi:fructose-1,6-bisphosphatase/inositol monophosphatase family enzyme
MSNFSKKDFIHELSFAVMKKYDEFASRVVVVEYIKNDNSRDVVTNLDREIHTLLEDMIASKYPSIRVKSEEGDSDCSDLADVKQMIMIDPIDGSKNYALGLPFYLTLIAYMEYGVVKGGAIVNPNNSELLIWDDSSGISNYNLTPVKTTDGPVYFAYGSESLDFKDSTIQNTIKAIDKHSSGFYRWGSAGSGLLELYKGNLKGFVGYEIKIWDAIPFIRLFEILEAYVHYSVQGQLLNLVISFDREFYKEIQQII